MLKIYGRLNCCGSESYEGAKGCTGNWDGEEGNAFIIVLGKLLGMWSVRVAMPAVRLFEMQAMALRIMLSAGCHQTGYIETRSTLPMHSALQQAVEHMPECTDP